MPDHDARASSLLSLILVVTGTRERAQANSGPGLDPSLDHQPILGTHETNCFWPMPYLGRDASCQTFHMLISLQPHSRAGIVCRLCGSRGPSRVGPWESYPDDSKGRNAGKAKKCMVWWTYTSTPYLNINYSGPPPRKLLMVKPSSCSTSSATLALSSPSLLSLARCFCFCSWLGTGFGGRSLVSLLRRSSGKFDTELTKLLRCRPSPNMNENVESASEGRTAGLDLDVLICGEGESSRGDRGAERLEIAFASVVVASRFVACAVLDCESCSVTLGVSVPDGSGGVVCCLAAVSSGGIGISESDR